VTGVGLGGLARVITSARATLTSLRSYTPDGVRVLFRRAVRKVGL
jgi:hypothetical protein